MLALSSAKSRGAVPYNVTPKHTAEAAAILGRSKWLAVEQKVCLETDAVKARWLAEDIQLRGAQVVVYIPFGQYLTPSAWRDNLDGLLTVPETVVFWNVRRKG